MKSADLFLRNLRNLRFLLAKAEQLQRKHRRLPGKGRGVLECEGGRPGTFHVKHRNTAPPSVSRETPRRSARRKRSADDADRKPQKTQKAGSQSAIWDAGRGAGLKGWTAGCLVTQAPPLAPRRPQTPASAIIRAHLQATPRRPNSYKEAESAEEKPRISATPCAAPYSRIAPAHRSQEHRPLFRKAPVSSATFHENSSERRCIHQKRKRI